jgi:hypothetical protein
MENGTRIEAKIDALTKVVNEMNERLGRYDERGTLLEKRFDNFLDRDRLATCPLRADVPYLCNQVDEIIKVQSACEKRLDVMRDDILDIRTRFKFMRWVTAGLIALISSGGIIVGILAATHII